MSILLLLVIPPTRSVVPAEIELALIVIVLIALLALHLARTRNVKRY